MKKLLLLVLILAAVGLLLTRIKAKTPDSLQTDQPQEQLDDGRSFSQVYELSIASLKQQNFPGGDIKIEETLSPAANYQRFLTSYLSEGLKVYALLTVPAGLKPEKGWPVIIFNHGYILPTEYRTTERYVAYTDAFARNGYIVFKPDYRGHGSSEGLAVGGYGSDAYTIDVLNALASVKKYSEADPGNIGMWGHSMGGHITLRSMVVSYDIKAGVIWAGVVASYPDLINNWRRRNTSPPPGIPSRARRWRDDLILQYGSPEKNPDFWNSISANYFLSDISGPLQLHHGTADTSVPIQFSVTLKEQMEKAGREVELFTYQGDDHNLSTNLSVALNRSVEFFDKYLKDK